MHDLLLLIVGSPAAYILVPSPEFDFHILQAFFLHQFTNLLDQTNP